jgi:hypothetical protein
LSARRRQASARVLGRIYSNGAGFMLLLERGLSGRAPPSLDRAAAVNIDDGAGRETAAHQANGRRASTSRSGMSWARRSANPLHRLMGGPIRTEVAAYATVSIEEDTRNGGRDWTRRVPSRKPLTRAPP